MEVVKRLCKICIIPHMILRMNGKWRFIMLTSYGWNKGIDDNDDDGHSGNEIVSTYWFLHFLRDNKTHYLQMDFLFLLLKWTIIKI